MEVLRFIIDYILGYFIIMWAIGFAILSFTSDNINWFYLAIVLFLIGLYFSRRPKFAHRVKMV